MALHIWNCSLECFTDDVILILPPDVGWVAATLVGIFPKDSWNTVSQQHCKSVLMLSGTKLWLIAFYSLILLMLYGLVGGVFISESHDFFLPTGH